MQILRIEDLDSDIAALCEQPAGTNGRDLRRLDQE
jgi:hypothetical protein